MVALIAIMMAAPMDGSVFCLSDSDLGGRRDCFTGSGVRVVQSPNWPWWHVVVVGAV